MVQPTPMATRFTGSRLAVAFALAACVFFLLAAQPFLPLLGIQNDEAIFMSSFMPPLGGYALRIGDFSVPLMQVNYAGALKAWIYEPIFAVFQPGAWSLREPAVAICAASVWLFFLLMRRIAGARAAVIGCGILAADALYLLTAAFDWGPVALQHLLLVGAMLALMRFYQGRGTLALAGGFFLLGLALWEKALAVWMLSGMGVAALALFPRQLLRMATWKRASVAALCFALGAAPLIVYNVNNHFDTFRGEGYNSQELAAKANALLRTGRGDGLFGWLVSDRPGPSPHAAKTALERISQGASRMAGHPRQSLLIYAFVLALLLAPLARGGDLRAILFALITMAVQWIQMAITVGAGGSMHHTILLWPLPEMAIAVSFAAASRRLGRAGAPAAAAVLAVIMAAGAIQINEYYVAAWRNGGAKNWSDAIYPLSDYVKSVPAGEIFCLDWGMLDSLRLLDDGQLPLDGIYGAIPPSEPGDMPRLLAALGEPDALFIAHTGEFEFFAGRNEDFLKLAETAGYRRETVARISDSFGRPTYEAYRFAAGR